MEERKLVKQLKKAGLEWRFGINSLSRLEKELDKRLNCRFEILTLGPKERVLYRLNSSDAGRKGEAIARGETAWEVRARALLVLLRQEKGRKIKGIDFDLLMSGEDGIWFYQPHGKSKRTVLILKLKLPNTDKKGYERAIKETERILFPTEITGWNEQGNRFLGVGALGFSEYSRKKAEKTLLELFLKAKIYGIESVPIQ